ncbi:hypothetical protein HPB50_019657 [Hyalomma asiaticum]|uniref:Uncharacterized protein n=1 Tax=Hyalomma asiaticum TaxID=266040 RepID=A0ACB7RUM2_HYAAI|nr:hypothetical protein HPB50_019657 [Hyalomma asiaticum]
MSQILLTGFRPIKGISEHFHNAALTSGEKLYAASHVLDVKEVDGLDVHAKCRSEVYEVILHRPLARPSASPAPKLLTIFSRGPPRHVDTVPIPVRSQTGSAGPFKNSKRRGAALTLTRRP